MSNEFQYATALIGPGGELFDFYPEDGWVNLAEAERAAAEWNEEEADSEDICVVVRRIPPVPASGWEQVPADRREP